MKRGGLKERSVGIVGGGSCDCEDSKDCESFSMFVEEYTLEGLDFRGKFLV